MARIPKKPKSSCWGMLFPIMAVLLVMGLVTFLFSVAVQNHGTTLSGAGTPPVAFDNHHPDHAEQMERAPIPGSQKPPASVTAPLVVTPTAPVAPAPAVVTTPNVPAPVPVPEVIKKKPANKGMQYHFVHIPKCGGTSMTAVLREVACHVDPEGNSDCCLNPGFCDWHAMRRCSVIKGCINHFPQRRFLFQDAPSVTVIREPVSRLISAFHYRGHSPNLDFFQVRKEFKMIKDGLIPKVEFPEYVEMNEYQNIMTRMLGADSFPYRDINITAALYAQAADGLDAFFFVGLQEAYDLSVQVLIRELSLADSLKLAPIKKERDQTNKSMDRAKKKIRDDNVLMERTREVNSWDMKLYERGVKAFCSKIKKYPDLLTKLHATTKVKCN